MKSLVAGLIALVTAGQPVGVGPCPGVRPGARIYIEGASYCTANFVYRGSDGSRYIGSAGHCFVGRGVTVALRPGEGAEIRNSAGRRVGEVAYGILEGPNDFGLVRLDEGAKSDPEMCHFGGPTGIFTGESMDPVVLHHYGHGTGPGYVEPADQRTVPARTAVAPRISDTDTIAALGATAPGDSGSPVIDSAGRAVGVLVELGGEGQSAIGIRRLGPQLARAERFLGIELKLLRAPFD